MHAHDPIILSRAVDALLIPSAIPVQLQKGQQVVITQSLGGSFTVHVEGNLVRVDGKDADALGLATKESKNPAIDLTGDSSLDSDEVSAKIWETLATCYDPEIPVNIVELGLIYRCTVVPVDGGGNRVEIDMTLTAPGCGMGPILMSDVKDKVMQVATVLDVNVELVFDPPWNQALMSEAAKLQLGML